MKLVHCLCTSRETRKIRKTDARIVKARLLLLMAVYALELRTALSGLLPKRLTP